MDKIIEWIKGVSPPWKYIAVACTCVLFAIFLLTSCANTKAVVRSNAEQTSSTITITTNNPTNVEVTNRIDTLGFKFAPKK